MIRFHMEKLMDETYVALKDLIAAALVSARDSANEYIVIIHPGSDIRQLAHRCAYCASCVIRAIELEKSLV